MSELLFEIGTEELPARFLKPVVDYWKAALPKELGEIRLSFDQVDVEASPRRLAIMVSGLAAQQDDVEEEVTGPKASIAWDEAGALTKAGQGFLRGRGLGVDDAYRKDTAKGEVIAAKVFEKGKQAEEILPGSLKTLMSKIPFPKTMRWTDEKDSFGRPVRWMVCLIGGKSVEFRFADVVSGDATRGHRFHAPSPIRVSSVSSYRAALEQNQVVLSHAERRAQILAAAEPLAKDVGGQLLHDDALLEIVADLVEKPWPLIGHFDPEFLAMPKELLLSEMREHQKYFGVVDQKGDLLPHFIVVAGSEPVDADAVAAGHSRVLRSRFEDGAFYFESDRKETLEERSKKLSSVMFQRDLGSLSDKTTRIQSLVSFMSQALDLESAAAEASLTAASLCKADLVSGVVGEFPELQGTMGRYYAQADGLSPAVAQAIEEHYAPRHAGASIPESDEGAMVALADRIDTIVGIMGIGKAPTGSADPFALRRAAIAFLHICMGRQYAFSLSSIIAHAITLLGDRIKVPEAELSEQVLSFFKVRLRTVLLERSESNALVGVNDIVDSTIAAGFEDQNDLLSRTLALGRLRTRDNDAFLSLAATFKRVGNILTKARTDGLAFTDLAETGDGWTDESERKLALGVVDTQQNVTQLKQAQDYDALLEHIAGLKPMVDSFFDNVMVMSEDAQERARRLGLLRAVEQILLSVADFSKVQFDQDSAS